MTDASIVVLVDRSGSLASTKDLAAVSTALTELVGALPPLMADIYSWSNEVRRQDPTPSAAPMTRWEGQEGRASWRSLGAFLTGEDRPVVLITDAVPGDESDLEDILTVRAIVQARSTPLHLLLVGDAPDADAAGVLPSSPHRPWAAAAAGTLGTLLAGERAA